MSSASYAHPGQPSFGSLAFKLLLIAIIWAALVVATMHYVGNVWPKAYQVSLAEGEAAKLKAEEATNPPKPEAPAATPAAAPAAPVASTPAPAAVASATSSAPAAGAAAPAASAPKASGEQKLPHDPTLAGYNRSALWNVAVFYSIVISTLCIGAMLVQLYKHYHIEEVEAAH